MSVTLTKTSKNTPLLIHNSYSYTTDRKTVTKILWKCEYSRKYSYHGRLHTTSNYEFIKIVGEHENHVGNSRCAATRKYFEKLKQESEQNHTNPHNIITQVNIGVPDEVRVQLPTNYNLKQNVRRWRQVNTTEPTPTTIHFPAILPLIYAMRPTVRATICPCDQLSYDQLSARNCPATKCPATNCPKPKKYDALCRNGNFRSMVEQHPG